MWCYHTPVLPRRPGSSELQEPKPVSKKAPGISFAQRVIAALNDEDIVHDQLCMSWWNPAEIHPGDAVKRVPAGAIFSSTDDYLENLLDFQDNILRNANSANNMRAVQSHVAKTLKNTADQRQ